MTTTAIFVTMGANWSAATFAPKPFIVLVIFRYYPPFLPVFGNAANVMPANARGRPDAASAKPVWLKIVEHASFV